MLKQSNLNKLKNPKYLVCFLTMFFALVYAGISIPEKLAFSPTNSVGHRFFFILGKATDNLEKGDYVLFPLYTKIRPNCWPCTVVKKIGCVGGDLLAVNQRNFFCNGEYIGTAKAYSKKGSPVMAFNYNGIVPAGKLFMMGTCKDSYDSRYIGFIDKKIIERLVAPII